MIAFVTSVRHPHNCNGPFSHVLGLLEQTLRSISRQSVPRFHIIVVGNEPFTLSFTDERIEYIWVDYPPPNASRKASFGMPDLRVDRGCKYLIGLLAAKRRSIDHVMFVDADDYVSNRIAAYSERQRSHNGWFVERGYLYDRGSGEFGRLDDFHMRCGTSHIVAGRLLAAPEALDVDASRDAVLASVPHDYLAHVLGSHRWIAEHLADSGTPLAPLPFEGAVYHIGHGENHTASSGVLRVRPTELSERVRHEFGIPFEVGSPESARS